MKQALVHKEKREEAQERAGRETAREVDSIADRLGLPEQVRRRANTIFRRAGDLHLGWGASRPVLAAASLYVGCREHRNPATLRDLADASGSEPRDVGRCYNSILERMHIPRPDLNGRRYVYHIAEKIRASDEAFKLSQEIIKRASLEGLGGRNPMTLAAASLYLACCNLGEKVTQGDLAEAAGVGEESVRECCKAIRLLDKQAETTLQ